VAGTLLLERQRRRLPQVREKFRCFRELKTLSSANNAILLPARRDLLREDPRISLAAVHQRGVTLAGSLFSSHSSYLGYGNDSFILGPLRIIKEKLLTLQRLGRVVGPSETSQFSHYSYLTLYGWSVL
jgi:hypothetical protein